MSGKTSIEWTEQTWNPVAGCSLVSPGCTNCYAMGQAARLLDRPGSHYEGTTKRVNGKPVWTGKIGVAPDSVLLAPLRRRKPTMFFVNSMADLFHEAVPDAVIDRVFAVMALSPQHTFQVLTKRAERMREYLSLDSSILRDRWYRAVPAGQWPVSVAEAYASIHPHCSDETRAMYRRQAPAWPLPNVWLGVSAEDQARADERIPDLLATPAAVRFVSAEPLLGPIDFAGTRMTWLIDRTTRLMVPNAVGLDWIIAGVESGKGARPMHPDWARSIRDQCAKAGVAFFFKQWGEYGPVEIEPPGLGAKTSVITSCGKHLTGRAVLDFPGDHNAEIIGKFGKARAGRLLDGVEHNAMPKVRS